LLETLGVSLSYIKIENQQIIVISYGPLLSSHPNACEHSN